MADMETEEELDYHITFPSPLSQDVPEVEDPNAEPEIISQQEPVVILLGWAGCKDKYLSKYSAIYDKRCITIRYTAPSGDIFCKPASLHTVAEKVLELISDLQLASNPIFFHVFSNGGCLVYSHITELVHSRSRFRHIRIRGVIFDSCPSTPSPMISARAYLSAAKERHFILRYLTALVLLLLLYFKVIIAYILRKPIGNDYFWEAMKKDPANCPQLYLYSKADEIVSYLAVEEQINSRKARVKVLTVCWDDSGHVKHFCVHRESYIKNCLDFIDMCMEMVL